MHLPVRSAFDRRDALAGTILACLVVAWWLGRFVLGDPGPPRHGSDLLFYYFPIYALAAERIVGGGLPLWNPWHALGTPWLATLQTGVFYPLHLPYLVFSTSTALAWSHCLHLLLVAIGTAAFTRRIGLCRSAATLAALLFTLRGFVPWNLQYPSLLEASAWLPLGCFGVVGLVSGARRRSALLLACCTAFSLLAGYPQATVLLMYAWGTLLLVLVWSERRRGAPARALAAFVAAAVLGVMLSAIQTLPTFELTLEGARSTGTLQRNTIRSMGGADFWSLREVLGSGLPAVGALSLALAPAALLAGRRRALVVWAACLGLLAHALASGIDPLLVEFYRNIPALGWFRHTTRLLLLSHFCLALLAAVSLDAIATRRVAASANGSRWFPDPARTAAGVSLGVALALALEAWRGGIQPAVWIAPGLALLLLASLRAGRGAWVGPACVLLALVESALGGTRMPRLPYFGEYAARLESQRPFHEALAAAAGPNRVVWLGLGHPPWGPLKMSARSDVRWFEAYEPLLLGRYITYLHYLRVGTLDQSRPIDLRHPWLSLSRPNPRAIDGPWLRSRLLDLAAVRLVVVPHHVADTAWAREILDRMGLVPVDIRHPRVRVFENPNAVPRAYVTYRARQSPTAPELLELLSRSDFDPMAASYLERPAGLATSAGAPLRGHPAILVRDESTVVEIDAALAAPGVLVLADAMARGWRVTVDGAPAPITPANYLFRGVPLPAGRHLVRFEYRPPGFYAGAAISGVASASILAASAFMRRRRLPG